ncbi:MAG: nucleotidyltransferase domain-containing protein [Fimbriimonadaceae bacterium]|nr:nucleotidyltransferase domain-containing protein [Fimbriimonadaceae bacterium]
MDGLELVEARRSQIGTLCRKYGVKRLRLFGSALRPDWRSASSDFDFLAEFGPPPPGINPFDQQFGLQVDLEKLLGRSVDVVDWDAAKKPLFRQMAESLTKDVYAS